MLGEVTPEAVAMLQAADAIVRSMKSDGSVSIKKVWQAFAVLLPIQTVGVMGDLRTYENVVALRASHQYRWHDRRLGAVAA